VDYEAELAFVIGKPGKNIKENEAYDYIAGYTVLNDVTARDFQRRHSQWFKGKGLDTFAPMGPCIVTKEEVPNPHHLGISLKLNSVLMQNSNTQHMIFKIPTLLRYLTMDMTVEPGDIIATGTPSGVGFTRKPPTYLKPGDVMTVTVEQVGVLQNKIVSQAI
jgi:2-keto-4-pentenoate hydratase/2-oxohepta-3-ene-1,7-dioic acid hydratase in catechol pathway